jgi:hypothetical protein
MRLRVVREYLRAFLKAASIAAVTTVEPFMFIGFALLYVQMTRQSSTLTEKIEIQRWKRRRPGKFDIVPDDVPEEESIRPYLGPFVST